MKRKNVPLIIFFCLLVLSNCEREDSGGSTVNNETIEAQELEKQDIEGTIEENVESRTNESTSNNQITPVITEAVNFSPLKADEILAFLKFDRTTVKIYAISLKRKTQRLIFEFPNSYWLASILFSDDAKLCFLRSAAEDYDLKTPLYFIDGMNGTISYLFDVNYSFNISGDGRFVAFVPDYQTDRNTISLFSMEERKIINNFYFLEDKAPFLRIYRSGKSNFRIFNSTEYEYADAEAEIDTQNSTLTTIRAGYDFEIDVPYSGNTKTNLNTNPRLRYALNIDLPPPPLGSFFDVPEELNLYSEPDISSEIIMVIEEDQPYRLARLELLEVGTETVVEDILSHWVKVKLWNTGTVDAWPSDIEGWCFMGLLVY